MEKNPILWVNGEIIFTFVCRCCSGLENTGERQIMVKIMARRTWFTEGLRDVRGGINTSSG